MNTSLRRSAGFTLIEIMIVVAIIAALDAMAISSYLVTRRNTRSVTFANDISKACNAFELYSIERGTYPPDTMPRIIPDGMQEFLPRMNWAEPTPIGGYWDWDNGQFGHVAGVSVYKPTCGDLQMVKIDELLDDGDLDTGVFQRRSQGYIYSIEF